MDDTTATTRQAQGIEPLNAYQTLCLHPAAPRELIDEAYWLLVERVRTNRASSSGERVLSTLNRAYEVLSDADRRQDLDRALDAEQLRSPGLRLRRSGVWPLGSRRFSADHADFYHLLRVDPGADAAIIALAYRVLSARAAGPWADASFLRRLLLEAYEVLGNPARRAIYDRSIGVGMPSPPAVAAPIEAPPPPASVRPIEPPPPTASVRPIEPPPAPVERIPSAPVAAPPGSVDDEPLHARPAIAEAPMRVSAPLPEAPAAHAGEQPAAGAPTPPAIEPSPLELPDVEPAQAGEPDAIPGAPMLLENPTAELVELEVEPAVAAVAPVDESQEQVAEPVSAGAGAHRGRIMAALRGAVASAGIARSDARTPARKKEALTADAEQRLLTLQDGHGYAGAAPTLASHPDYGAAVAAAELLFIDGPHSGARVSLGDEAVTVGSAHEADVMLPDDTGEVAPEHVRIWRHGDRFVLRQIADNGTLVGGEAPVLRLVMLDDGDEIQIGVHRMRFSLTA